MLSSVTSKLTPLIQNKSAEWYTAALYPATNPEHQSGN